MLEVSTFAWPLGMENMSSGFPQHMSIFDIKQCKNRKRGMMMRTTGFEPARTNVQRILSPTP
jgi:hypothetical protein